MNPRRNPPHMLPNNPDLTQGNITSQPLPTNRSAHQQPGPSANTDLLVQALSTLSLLQTPDAPIRNTDTNTNLSTTYSSGGTSAASFDPYGQFGPKSSATGPSSLRPQRHIQPVYPIPHLPNAHLVPGLLGQTIFPYSRLDYRPLASQEADFLKRAIRIAHRLVFSAKSIDVLHFIMSGGTRKDPNRTPELVSYLSALTQNDGLSVVIDCESMQVGFVTGREPRILRISATLVNQAIRIRSFGSIMSVRRHLFFLASVVAHLICGSIRFLAAGLDIKGWRWENNFFGGTIERVMAPDGSIKGEIEQLVLSICDRRGRGWIPLSDEILVSMTGESSDWEQRLPLVPPKARLNKVEPPRLLHFHETWKE